MPEKELVHNIESIKAIREALPYRSQDLIATKIKKSAAYVTHQFRNYSKINPDVRNQAIEILEKNYLNLVNTHVFTVDFANKMLAAAKEASKKLPK